MKAHFTDGMLPAMRCDTGCGRCCNVVPVSQPEYQLAMAYASANGVIPLKQGITCPFYQDGACAVYEARPATCRLYGHVPAMTCPRGYNTNVSSGAERAMMRRALSELRSGIRFLHECVYTVDELVGVISQDLGVGQMVPLTVGGTQARRPSEGAYNAARALKLSGKAFTNVAFVDQTTGEVQ